ncbi:MAG: hypothetical protein WCE36_25895 [Pseudolabrys sp.]
MRTFLAAQRGSRVFDVDETVKPMAELHALAATTRTGRPGTGARLGSYCTP